MNQATHPTHRFNPLAGGTAGEQGPAACQSRPGYAMAEAILAFAILGTALAGLSPFVVTHLRLIHKLETRFQGNPVTRCGQSFLPNQTNTPQTYFSVPWKNPRMQSLFGRAAITIGSATITNAQGNAVDDYINSYTGSPTKSNTLTIYNYTFVYTDMTSDPQSITVNLDAGS
jgi:hypothetical protein